LSVSSFFLLCYVHLQHLHSFPTRRSSDLKTFMNIGPRLDFALNKNNTLSIRYNLNATDLKKQGIGGFALASRAFDYSDRLHILQDRKSTRLNSSHVAISYAVFCLKKKNKY